jgi:phospho-N-acetylmuramoyl-pentapeptide-transferase
VIYELLYPLSREFGWASALNVLRYVPFRIIMAIITAMVMSFVLAPWFIRELQKKQIGQVVRKDGPESHHIKAGTPTMGGALILLSVLVPTMLWADVHNDFVVATAAVTAGYGVIGYIDDRLKITKKNTKGLAGRYKLIGQTLIATLALLYVFADHPQTHGAWDEIKFDLALPFMAFSKASIELPAWAYIAFGVFVVVAMSNGVNLTALCCSDDLWPSTWTSRVLQR